MRFTTLFCSALLVGTSVAQTASDSVNFKRTFKNKEEEIYKMDLTPLGAKTPAVSANFEIIVDRLVGNDADVTYRALFGWHGNQRLAAKDVFPTVTYKVSPDAMPTDYSDKNEETSGGPLFCSACWITPNATCRVGKPIPIHWTSGDNGVTLDGRGVISNLDKTAKRMSVNWDLTIAFSGGKGVLKVKSIYSTDDFSLISAKASAPSNDKNDQPFSMSMTRLISR